MRATEGCYKQVEYNRDMGLRVNLSMVLERMKLMLKIKIKELGELINRMLLVVLEVRETRTR